MTDSDRNRQSISWEFFDKIYCISLESRPDRLLAAKKQFAAVGLAGLVEFYIAKKNMADQAQGIFQSHVYCIRKGLAADANHILIFEDDILFRGFKEQTLLEACRFLGDTKRWDCFFLGCITSGSTRTEIDQVMKIKYRCLAHAYAINRPFAERLSRVKWSGIPFDNLLFCNNKNFFAIHPMCAFQGLAGSDNRTVLIDRLRSLLGGLPFIQRINEFYQNNKMLIVALHLLVAFIAITVLALRIRP